MVSVKFRLTYYSDLPRGFERMLVFPLFASAKLRFRKKGNGIEIMDDSYIKCAHKYLDSDKCIILQFVDKNV